MNGLEALDELCQIACNDRDTLNCLQHKNCKEAEENIKFKPYCNGCPYCGGELKKIIEKELKDGEKHKKFFEIIKSHAKENKHFRYLLYMAKYWEGNEVEVTKELLENYDFPYTVDEFNFLKEELR